MRYLPSTDAPGALWAGGEVVDLARWAGFTDRVEALDAQHCQALAASPTQRLADQLRERLGLG